MNVRVLKFGGTSVGRLAGLEQVLAVVADTAQRSPVVVVVSALCGVTDELVEAARRLNEGTLEVEDLVARLETRHVAHLASVAEGRSAATASQELSRRFASLAALLHQSQARGGISPRERDELLANGERLVVPIVVAGLARRRLDVSSLDAAELIVTDDTPGEARWDGAATLARVQARLVPLLAAPGQVVVVPGFLAADGIGRTTLLGRGGSDTSATLLGAALAAEAVEIWTDVDGVHSADPKLLRSARPLPELTYREAAELARYGARVLHHRALEPAERAGVPILVRNTFNPTARPTRIVAAAEPDVVAKVGRSSAALAVSALGAEGGLARLALVKGSSSVRLLLSLATEVLRVAGVPLLALVAASPWTVVAVVRERDLGRAVEHLHHQLVVAEVEEVCHALAS